MITTSHAGQRIGTKSGASTEALILADAFSEFISASSRLEAFYGDLQHEVSQLGLELTERNAALTTKLGEAEGQHRSLQQVIESLPCGVLLVDGQNSVAIINAEARRLLDLDESSAVGLKTISTSISLDLSQYLHSGSESDERQFCIHTAGGERWLALRSGNVSGGSSISEFSDATILMLRDVTLEKAKEREQMGQAALLSERSVMLAHEIRGPLASLEILAGLIADEKGESSRWTAQLRAHVRLLSRTVDNLLRSNDLRLPAYSSLNLTEALRGGVEFARPIADEAGAELIFHAEHPAIIIRSDVNALHQLVLNMITHAVREMVKGGCIRVCAKQVLSKGSFTLPIRALIEFSYPGIGIEARHGQHFLRTRLNESADGADRALAACMQIVHQHQGEIRQLTASNAETGFVVELPIL